jgi:kumamolisin
MVVVNASVDQLEKAFHTEIHHYEKEHPRLGRYKFRTHTGFHVPDHIHPMLHAILGVHTEYKAVRATVPPADLPNGVSFTPQQISGIYSGLTTSANQQVIGLYGWLQNATEIQNTLNNWGLASAGTTTSTVFVSVDGSTNGSDPNSGDAGEGNVDNVMILGFSGGVKTLAIYFADRSAENYPELLARMLHPNPGDPVVTLFSISSVFTEDFEQNTYIPFFNACETYHEDAALIGVTIISAVGDEGSSNYFPSTTENWIAYPCGSPWILNTGGTTVASIGTGQYPTFTEWVWNDNPNSIGATGGGISRIFPRPTYQTIYVPNMPAQSDFGFIGRGMPDVAGNASSFSGYNTEVNGAFGVIGGTSVTAPQYAGCLARVMQALGRPLGFLNPTIYHIQQGLWNAQAANGAGVNITDTHGNVFSLVTSANNGLQIANHGTVDATTANVVYLLYMSPPIDLLFQQNSSGLFYEKSPGDANSVWAQVNDPIPFLLTIRDIGTQSGSGTNNSSNGSPGYPVVNNGWDACTGWGVVNFQALTNYLVSASFDSIPVWFQVQATNAQGTGPTSQTYGPFTTSPFTTRPVFTIIPVPTNVHLAGGTAGKPLIAWTWVGTGTPTFNFRWTFDSLSPGYATFISSPTQTSSTTWQLSLSGAVSGDFYLAQVQVITSAGTSDWGPSIAFASP